MTRTRNMSDLLDSSGDVKSSALDNTSSDLVDDSTPQLGGVLDTNGNAINDASGVDLQHNGTTKLSTTSTGANITGELTVDKLTVQDDGSGSAIVEVRADDNSPWAFLIGNDSFSTGDHGILSYVDNDGTGRIQSQGKDGVYEDLNFTQNNANSGSTRNLIQLASNGEARLFYQGNQKLATKTGGVDITGILSATIPHAICSHDNSTSFNGTARKQGLDTAISSSGVTISTSNNRFTPTVAGYYLSFTQVAFSGSANTGYTPNISLRRNGVSFQDHQFIENYSASHSETHMMMGLQYFNGSSHYLEVFHSHNAGSTMTSNGKGTTTMFLVRT